MIFLNSIIISFTALMQPMTFTTIVFLVQFAKHEFAPEGAAVNQKRFMYVLVVINR